MKTFISLPALAAAIVLAAGCTSAGHRHADRTAGSLERAAADIQATLPLFDAALFALSDMVNETGTDVAPQFHTYTAAVARLESQVRAVGLQSGVMERQGLDHFESWNKSLTGIQDGRTRGRSLDRKLELGAQFERARGDHARSTAELAAFMADLQDIRIALAADLTHEGLRSVRGLAGRTGAKGAPLRASLEELSEDFRSLGQALVSSTPAS